MKVLKVLLGTIVGLIVLVVGFTIFMESETSSTDSVPTTPAIIENWTVEQTTDDLTGDSITLTHTTSINKIDFEFPYDGGSDMKIIIRKEGSRKDLILRVSKGQFLSEYSRRPVEVRFDGGQVIKYNYQTPNNGDADYIFITNASAFISKLKSAKAVKIDAPFFKAGQSVFEFNVEVLK